MRTESIIDILQSALVQPPNIDPLIDALSEGRVVGKESPVFEVKASFLPKKGDSDPKQACQWNVVEALVAMSNSYGGILVLGIREEKDGSLLPGGVDHIEKMLEGHEPKDYRSIVLGKKHGLGVSNSKTKYIKVDNKGVEYTIRLSPETRTRLMDERYLKVIRCKSRKGVQAADQAFTVLAFLVEPLPAGMPLLSVDRICSGNSSSQESICFRRMDEGGEVKVAEDDYASRRNPDRFKKLLERCKYAVERPPVSTLPGISAGNVLGRDLAISQIDKLLCEGRIPVLHGAPGIGKSTLAFLYAERNTLRYPGGRFLARMDGVDSWEEAFERLLNEDIVSGTSMSLSKWLGLPDDKNEITFDSIWKALCARAEWAGPLLVVLANVDSIRSLFAEDSLRKAFPKGIPEGIHFIATTCIPDNKFGGMEKPKLFRVRELSRQDAMELLERGCHINGDRERSAADELCKILGGRPLYLNRISVLIPFDPDRPFHAGPYQDTLSEFQTDLLKASESGAYDDKRTPAFLWRKTKDQLFRDPDGAGEAAVFLVRIRALFNPDLLSDQFLRFILEQVDPKETVDFTRAKNKLVRFNLVGTPSSSDTSIHRLDQEAIRRDDPDEIKRILDMIGNALSVFPTSRWAKEFLRFCPELLPYAPLSDFSSDDLFWMLWYRPELAVDTNWSGVPFFRVFDLIYSNSRIAKYVEVPWSEFWGSLWAILLGGCYTPVEFSRHCDWQKLKGADWALLLAKRPLMEFWRNCDDWSKLELNDWEYLLRKQPQFSKRCTQMDRLSNSLKAELLPSNPELEDYVDWKALNGEDWVRLLDISSMFASRCDWSKLAESDWVKLLEKHPEFVHKCEHPELFSNSTKAKLLVILPKLADDIDWNSLTAQDWSVIIKGNAEYADRCPWNTLDCETQAGIISERPELVGHVDLAQWSPESWRRYFIFADSDAIERVVPWDALPRETWVYLLENKPEYTNRCQWDLLAAQDWFHVLEYRPELVTRPEVANKKSEMALDEENVKKLVSECPELASWFGVPIPEPFQVDEQTDSGFQNSIDFFVAKWEGLCSGFPAFVRSLEHDFKDYLESFIRLYLKQ